MYMQTEADLPATGDQIFNRICDRQYEMSLDTL